MTAPKSTIAEKLADVNRKLDALPALPAPRHVSTLSLDEFRALAQQMNGFRNRLIKAGIPREQAMMLAAAAGLELLPR